MREIGPAGFEPATSCTRGRRSTKLSHGPISLNGITCHSNLTARFSAHNPASIVWIPGRDYGAVKLARKQIPRFPAAAVAARSLSLRQIL